MALFDLSPIADRPGKKFADWAAKFTITLEIDEKAKIAPTSTFVENFTRSVLNIGAGFSEEGKASRDAQITFEALKIGALGDKLGCTRVDQSGAIVFAYTAGDNPLYGNLGIYEWLKRSFEAFDEDTDIITNPQTITHTSEFQITSGGSLTPNVAFLRSVPPTSVQAAFTAERQDIQRLIIALTEP